MTTISKQLNLSLAHEAMFSVADAAGVQVICREGSLWVTVDKDLRDIVLAPGESFTTPQHRRVLIFALQPASLSLVPAPLVPSIWQRGKKSRAVSASLTLQPA